MTETAVDWFYEQIKFQLEQGIDLSINLDLIYKEAKQKERYQHGNTWDAAIKAHDDRGHVLARSICDFDDYQIK